MRCNVGPFGVTFEATLHHTLHAQSAWTASTSPSRCNVCNVESILTREKTEIYYYIYLIYRVWPQRYTGYTKASNVLTPNRISQCNVRPKVTPTLHNVTP